MGASHLADCLPEVGAPDIYSLRMKGNNSSLHSPDHKKQHCFCYQVYYSPSASNINNKEANLSF